MTANAQLIASILEDEDGKTANEIACWCDELEMLSDEELQKLMNGLTKEGVISLENDRYYLICPCAETLVCPEDVRNRRIDRDDDFYTDQRRAQAKLFLYMMERENKPLCDTDCLDLLGRYFSRHSLPDEYQAAKDEMSIYSAERNMNLLAEKGYTRVEFRMNNRSGEIKKYYWLKLLGGDEK